MASLNNSLNSDSSPNNPAPYQPLARRWRPNRFDELVGQESIAKTLTNAIRFHRVAHAYLFSGPRGVGKTSVARIFAKALRCETRNKNESENYNNNKNHTASFIEPCNYCSECIAITESRSIDVLEMDGASHNGVEAIRNLRDNIAYRPTSGDYKIYIIDEVHMLSTSAFNALLKTLEEPPKQVVFLFATTEEQKIPLTILSRCQRFDFQRFTATQIFSQMKKILEKEETQITDEGLQVLVSYSDGVLRDGLSLLDQVLAYFAATKKQAPLTELQVTMALGVSQNLSLVQFLEAIFSENYSLLFSILEEMHQTGVDFKRFAERCLEKLRVLYLLRFPKDKPMQKNLEFEKADLSPQDLTRFQKMAEKTTLLQLEKMAAHFSLIIPQLGSSSYPRFILEMAAVRMATRETTEVKEQENQKAQPSFFAEPPLKSAEVSQPHYSPQSPMQPHSNPSSKARTWRGFIEFLMKKRPLLGALLAHADFHLDHSVKDGNIIRLSFERNSFYEQQSRDKRNHHDILELAKEFFGSPHKIEIVGQTENLHKELSLEKQQENDAKKLEQETLRDPVVVQMQEVLQADLVSVQKTESPH